MGLFVRVGWLVEWAEGVPGARPASSTTRMPERGRLDIVGWVERKRKRKSMQVM